MGWRKKMKQETKKIEEKKQPKAKFRAGSVTATVWENDLDRDVKGKKETFKVQNVVIERSYKDNEDEWMTTNSYSKQNLIDLETVLHRARQFMCLKEDIQAMDEEIY